MNNSIMIDNNTTTINTNDNKNNKRREETTAKKVTYRVNCLPVNVPNYNLFNIRDIDYFLTELSIQLPPLFI